MAGIAADRAHALARRLRERIDGEVRFDPGARALYATDGSNYREPPIGVVVPRHLDDGVATVAACREFDAPVLSRGGGTSLAGQCCNTAVVIDWSKWCNRILEIDSKARTALVEPGCILDRLREATAEHDLTFGPDPATHAHNTLGGMIGNNSCGVHSVMAGRTADNVIALEVLTYDGARFWVGGGHGDGDELAGSPGGDARKAGIYRGLRELRDRHAPLIRERYPDIPRRVSGYNLDELLPEHGTNVARALVGSEGTCVVVLRARLRLVPRPPCRALLVLGYPDVCEAAAHVPEVLEAGPVGLEGIDEALVDFMRRKGLHPEATQDLPEGGGWLMAEFGGDSQKEADGAAGDLRRRLCGRADAPAMALFSDPGEQAQLWRVRESGLAATAHVPGERETHPGWEDAAVPPQRLAEYLRDFRALLRRYDYHCALYGHFGDGCVHCRIDFQLGTPEGVEHWRRFLDEAADLVLRYGGSLSGEHGDGRARAALLPKMYGDALVQAFRDFKALWDPHGRMNPGRIVGAAPVYQDLRIGPGVHLPKVDTAFDYAEDRHQFSRATLRCVGVGTCRDLSGGVMCPSYRATRDEQHSTRGRARLLHEMLRGGPLERGWRSDAVRDALHLCLACKGCKRDCPVNVDMATYKAEFMARHYRGRLRPRDAYSMGLIFWWSRAASHAPRLANAALRAPGLSRAFKALGGIASEREFPRFARPTFKRWFARREPAQGRPVLLWADTFGNYFQPGPLQAAAEVLEAAGYRPIVAQRPLCCARPLYAEGMLDLARAQLTDTLDALAPHLDADLPMVGTEPSCIASFRDELPRLFPADGRARHLAESTFLLGEFLEREGYEPPPLAGRVLFHPHCNHHAVIGTDADERLLERLELDYAFTDAGCCGMAGSFGFAADRYPVSLAIAEDALLPKIRAAGEDTLLLASGFSCREQIRQCTGRRALDLAEVLRMAVHAQPQRRCIPSTDPETSP